ncbi:testis-specific serine/threonine-protein kinase 6-like isoform X2 [Sipha flava]|uniref:Testis-specific serine/threonine-protein kinase 6-like isoform X2 n=1 Tax=Sipha flava TaxID=143950 RepID=A0A8B8G777_9HEMI|nr:testis-specific serine/threonine-protein kinase 6-like isoform X2 [Sipha flava]
MTTETGFFCTSQPNKHLLRDRACRRVRLSKFLPKRIINIFKRIYKYISTGCRKKAESFENCSYTFRPCQKQRSARKVRRVMHQHSGNGGRSRHESAEESSRRARQEQRREQDQERHRLRLLQHRNPQPRTQPQQPYVLRAVPHGRPPPSPPPECLLQVERPRVIELPDDGALSTALADHGYRVGSTVGHGSYSKVRVGIRSRPDGTVLRLACKVIDKRRVAGGGSSYVTKFLPRELQLLCAVRHPHVIRTHQIYATPSTVHVFMDYCENGDLLSHLQRNKGMPRWQAHAFFKQLCEAVDYLHRNDIAHRDIKCENVLLESMELVKLTDFGFARTCVDDRGRQLLSQTYCGSLSYAAPEVLQGLPYEPKPYDVWALGVILYVMLADTMPFHQSDRQRIVAKQMAKTFYTPKKYVAREAMHLISIPKTVGEHTFEIMIV